MENDSQNNNYAKIVEEELSKQEPEKPTIPEQPTGTSEPEQSLEEPITNQALSDSPQIPDPTQTQAPTPAPDSNQEQNNKFVKKVIAIALIFTAVCVLTLIVSTIVFFVNKSEIPVVNIESPDEEEKPKAYALEMPDLDVKIDLPESLKGKIFSESDGENYYVWGYTEDEKPEFIVEKDSPDFFPLFALNYSKEEFETEKYSFSAGDGAYGREDGSVLYFHMIVFNDIENAEEISYKLENGIELNSEETALVEKYQKIYEEIDNLSFYFKDGFKYQDL